MCFYQDNGFPLKYTGKQASAYSELLNRWGNGRMEKQQEVTKKDQDWRRSRVCRTL
jgi:hypothetical protein